MTDQTAGKGEGRGRGRFTEKGVQAQQSSDIEALKALVADFGARLDALEAGEITEPGNPDEPYVDNTLPGDLPQDEPPA